MVNVAVTHSVVLIPLLWRVPPITLSSQIDMPSLTAVTFPHAFECRRTVHIKSICISSPSFLDITPALQQYLSFPLSSTHDSVSILSKRIIHTSLPSLSSYHTDSQFPIEECMRMCHSIISQTLALFPIHSSINHITLTH